MTLSAVARAEAAPAPAPLNEGPLLAELSRRLVQLMRRDAGRGPTRADIHWAGPDVLVAVFDDGFLRSERTLLSNGLEAVAMAYRGAIQHALRQAMRDEVERSMERTVIAAMGCAHHDPDLVVELFVFESENSRSGGDRFADGGAGAVPASPHPHSRESASA